MKKLRYGVNVRENMEEFLTKLMEDYHVYAGLQFAIYDYSFYETCRECGDSAKELTSKFRLLVSDYLSGNIRQETGQGLLELRNLIIGRMEAVSAFADIFTLYEYILNRMELKFSGESDDFDNDEEAREILKRIFAGSDNSVINLRIQMMLSQLPVRMTKVKFLEIIEDSLALYENSECSTVEKLLYMIRSAAGIYHPEEMDAFPDYLEDERDFAAVKYKEITEVEYDELCERLEEISTSLNELSDYYTGFQEAVNQLYILTLTEPYVSEEAKVAARRTEEITRWIEEHFDETAGEDIPATTMKLFQTTEGELERLSESIKQAEAFTDGLLDHYGRELEEQGLVTQAECLEVCALLSSSSLFVKLEEEESGEIADRTFIEETTKKLQKEFEQLLEGKETTWKRAVMAAVCKELPVFFPSKTAVMEYVRYSLENCRDYSEKRISVDLLFDQFEEIDGI